MYNHENGSVRVLHIAEKMAAAGIESFIMNNYRRIDRTKVQFDFLVLRNQKEFYDEEIKALGGRKYFVESSKKNTFLRVLDESKQIERFLKENKYDIVHIHYTTPLRAPYLHAALKAGCKVRIYHSHSAYVLGKNKVKLAIYNFMRKKISKWGTHFFACSEAAAKWMYEESLLSAKKHRVIYNGIDVEKFKFNADIREKIREELNIQDKFVMIHTGRFLEQKNHCFIVDVFEKFKKEKCNNACLLLLGIGPLQDEIKDKVKEKGISDDVIFLDVKPDVYNYLSAADCYIMPSLYEGLPVAAVEAECSGLPCVFSTNITKEIALIDKTTFLSLDDSIEKWCDAILKYKDCERKDCSEIIRSHGYNAQDVADNLQRFYLLNEMK